MEKKEKNESWGQVLQEVQAKRIVAEEEKLCGQQSSK